MFYIISPLLLINKRQMVFSIAPQVILQHAPKTRHCTPISPSSGTCRERSVTSSDFTHCKPFQTRHAWVVSWHSVLWEMKGSESTSCSWLFQVCESSIHWQQLVNRYKQSYFGFCKWVEVRPQFKSLKGSWVRSGYRSCRTQQGDSSIFVAQILMWDIYITVTELHSSQFLSSYI